MILVPCLQLLSISFYCSRWESWLNYARQYFSCVSQTRDHDVIIKMYCITHIGMYNGKFVEIKWFFTYIHILFFKAVEILNMHESLITAFMHYHKISYIFSDASQNVTTILYCIDLFSKLNYDVLFHEITFFVFTNIQTA